MCISKIDGKPKSIEENEGLHIVSLGNYHPEMDFMRDLLFSEKYYLYRYIATGIVKVFIYLINLVVGCSYYS